MDATVGGEIYQRRAMTTREQGTSRVRKGRFQLPHLCDRERNRFSSVVPVFNVALQVDVDEFKDQI